MKHDTREKRAIAEANTVLRVQVGSGLHGVTVDSQDDRDEMGLCIEPPEYVIGLRRFEQYEYRTQPEHVRSGPGDLDLVVYSLRKWATLAVAGNPTVLLPLFAPASEIVEIAWPGRELRAQAHLFVSRQAGTRFIGYLQRQRDRAFGGSGRPELVEKYGYDTKFAYHAVRLGMQGIKLLSTGRITLPIPEPSRSRLLDIRHGRLAQHTVVDEIEALRGELAELTMGADLPERADYDAVNRWLTRTYRAWWGG
ncbi:nucleotidyltransferase domain-containing protein [Mycobacterium branderi]|uniref:Nucleotidyltransferase n=1 Tax=Mycobacterium branderi TaxID=43348 RepID=A0A7I7WC73_9MYCO|nr:nucleotidyltransferase domain-containing protein [Mycobacterium branderi]MCV7236301.1 nucleotidyltransferase domain-containing protein [Mycobacterium branderi]ORA35472.1 nucleotidyltransferase [Mycobacterium branderi]BBZ15186.1 hypothetical protein MBRA_53810 [Mycobacterium branderi]